MSFQRWLLLLVVIGLFVSGIIFTFSINSTIRKKQWPPLIANCPDYWVDQTGDGSKCVSVNFNEGDGTSCSGTVDFSRMNICNKYDKMKKCKSVIWEGVTYSNPQALKCDGK